MNISFSELLWIGQGVREQEVKVHHVSRTFWEFILGQMRENRNAMQWLPSLPQGCLCCKSWSLIYLTYNSSSSFFSSFSGCIYGIWKHADKGWIGAAAAGLYHNHSNARSEPHLWPAPQLMLMLNLNLLSKLGIAPACSWILVGVVTHWATVGILLLFPFNPIVE